MKRVAVLCDVTASQIIEEIKRLDPKEQIGIIRFAYQLDAERRLTGKELSASAERMVNTSDPRKRLGSAKRLSEVSTVNANTPKVRREHSPPGLLNHLLDRISDRQITLVVRRYANGKS